MIAPTILMIRRVRPLLAAVVLCAAAPGSIPIATPIGAMARGLRDAGIPVLVPTRVLAGYGTTYATTLTYANEAPRDRGYSIVLGAIPQCEGTVCMYAEIDAGVGADVEHAPGTPVTLADGTRATFTSHACGANRAGSTSIWFRRGRVFYAVSAKGDPEPSLLVIANSLRLVRAAHSR